MAMGSLKKVILCLNAGSSSLKFALIDCKKKEVLSGSVEHIGDKTSDFLFRGKTTFSCPNHKSALTKILSSLRQEKNIHILATVHRIVHGLNKYKRPTLFNAQVIKELTKQKELAPLHLPNEIMVAKSCMHNMKKAKHIACFDTAFFETLPEIAKTLPIGKIAKKYPIKRFGFHGISYEYLTTKIPKNKKVVLAHLGHGSSLSAIHNQKPMDTTMSFSPTSGVLMSSRTGDLDPSILLYLLEKKVSPKRLEKMCNFESGLLGISEETANMKQLLKSKKAKAKLAVNMYCLSVAKAISSLATTLSGIDLLVFSAGIGERSSVIRKKIIDHLGFLGAKIDTGKNKKNDCNIATKKSKFSIQVIPTNENLQMAQHAMRILKGKI